ncbi:MAG TPA: hypothetical protein VJN93_15825 [Candidatus Acidoferrum sp.]|nr:hypothetical protein [Candidatus Acidoferrum sp.]
MRKLMLLAALSLFWAYSGAAQCGGEERWAVKDGTDASADQVKFSNVVNETLAALIQRKEPKLPADNTTRIVPQETSVVQLQARLIQWKLEADSDYHLVLTDDTLQFTPAGGKPTGHSLIGEIPDPNCLSGSHDDFGTQSPFVQIAGNPPMGIATARQQLNEAFPNADLTGGWNDAGGARVEIIGVTFYDPPHGQVSRAPNNLELHPIVSIKFLDNPLAMTKPAAGGHARPHAVAGSPSAETTAAGTNSISLTDRKTGQTATVNEDGAVVVARSEQSGRGAALRVGISSADLGYPKTLTVCWFEGSSDGKIQISLDGKNWFDVEPTPASGCKAVPPARFVRLTGSKGMYQVSY